MTSPTRTPRPGLSRHARAWTRRLTATVTATTAGGVMLLGSPVLSGGAAASSPSGIDTADPAVRLVAAERHRWPGHPGRSLVRYRVKRGDTATGVAVRFHAWTRELRRVNHLGRHGTLYAGRVIRCRLCSPPYAATTPGTTPTGTTSGTTRSTTPRSTTRSMGTTPGTTSRGGTPTPAGPRSAASSSARPTATT